MANSTMYALPADKEGSGSESLPVGYVLCERWRICKWIGAGGMGTVFEAEHRNGNRVAIKVLHRERRTHPEFRKGFLREGVLTNRVGHPDVVRIFDDGETTEGDVFLVMELLEGENLERQRRKHPLSVREVLRIADRVLDVLEVAHAKGVVHRDIKPSNILLVARDGAVKVLDFGIASLSEMSTRSMLSLPSSLGSPGTPSFMAPEQARGASNRIDCRTDLWALGATMFTLLTGRLVHEEQSAEATLVAAATVPCRLIGSLRGDLPMCVTDLVDRALSFEQEKRFEHAAEMRSVLLRSLDRCYSDALRCSSPSVQRGEPQTAETLPPTTNEDASLA
jgi:serine/threonine-protein kinase